MIAPDPYWLGVGMWLIGFSLYLYGAHWQHSFEAARLGTLLCWIGFAATAWPISANNAIPSFEWPSSFNLRSPTTAEIYAVIYIGWSVGMLTVVASWLRIVPSYIGWVGFTVAMTSTVASWVQDPLAQAAVGAVGVFLVLLLLIGKTSGSKRATLPGNYEAELLRLCYGDTAVASRLIKRELKRHPRFSRQAAAMAAVARLKRDR